jgi:hypothetical protein
MSNTGEDCLTKDTPMNPDAANMGYNYWTKEQMNNWLVANGLTVMSVGEPKTKFGQLFSHSWLICGMINIRRELIPHLPTGRGV